MKFKHKVLIGLVGLSLLLPMCAKQSESVDSTEQQQPIATEAVERFTPVTNHCKVDFKALHSVDQLRSTECQNYRSRINLDSYEAKVTDSEIKLKFNYANEPDRGIVLILNRVTSDYTVINFKGNQQDELSGRAVLTVLEDTGKVITVFADLYAPSDNSLLNSYGFTINKTLGY